jgi:histidinol phosphatase-like enzyme
MDSSSYSYENQNMSISQKQSIITLLPKKDNDIRFLKNWRLISLLNTDYKKMTKCTATRLKNILKQIINKNQSGFIKGRYIGDNIRSLLEVIDLAEEENLKDIDSLIFNFLWDNKPPKIKREVIL